MRRARAILIFGAGICALFAVAVPAWACVAANPSYLNALQPNRGPAGTTVVVSGGGWVPNQGVTISWTASGRQLLTPTTTANGTFSANVTIPADAGSGIGYVQAAQGGAETRATPFQVETSSPSSTSSPASPKSAPPANDPPPQSPTQAVAPSANSSPPASPSPPPNTPSSNTAPAGGNGPGPAPAGGSSNPAPPPASPARDGGGSASPSAPSNYGSASSPSPSPSGAGPASAAGTTNAADVGPGGPGDPSLSSPLQSGPADAAATPSTAGDPELADANQEVKLSSGTQAALGKRASGHSTSIGPLSLVLLAGLALASVAGGAIFSQRRRNRFSPS